MPETKLRNLISDLHERFAGDFISPEHEALLNQLNNQLASEEGIRDPQLMETLDLLVTELESEYPKAAGIVRQMMNVIENIGV